MNKPKEKSFDIFFENSLSLFRERKEKFLTGVAQLQPEMKKIAKEIEVEYSSSKLPPGSGSTLKTDFENLVIANLNNKYCFTENIRRAPGLMRFTMPTGLNPIRITSP